MISNTTINLARLVFMILTVLLGLSLASGQGRQALWLGGSFGFAFGLSVVLIDQCLKNFSIRGFSTGTFGLLIGLLCAWLVTRIGFFESPWMERFELAHYIFELAMYCGLGFLGMMLALRSKREEFSFVIPYVRFRQESVQDHPLLVDTSVIIDGRIAKVYQTGFLGGSFIVPRFVLDELQRLGDSRDEIRRQRGKRGLDNLNQMKRLPGMELIIHEDAVPAETEVDAKLIRLASLMGARLITNDSSLTKVARLQGVSVLNLNDLAQSMRPVVAPGDELELNLVKEGKDAHQAVGYLADGTMIVVNQAVDKIGTTQLVVVAGAVQTSAGRLIFAELKGAA